MTLTFKAISKQHYNQSTVILQIFVVVNNLRLKETAKIKYSKI